MDRPVNLFIAISVVLLIAQRLVAIVRDAIAETAPSPAHPPGSVVDATLHAAGRMLVLLGTALAISLVIAMTEHATRLGA